VGANGFHRHAPADGGRRVGGSCRREPPADAVLPRRLLLQLHDDIHPVLRAYALGRLAILRGRTERARANELYRALIEPWKDGDPEVPALVESASSRVED